MTDLPVVPLKPRGSAKDYYRGAPASTPEKLHPNTVDITGQMFGRIEVIGFSGKRKHRNIVWDCVCLCGKKCEIKGNDLQKGKVKSCGCYREEVMFKQSQKLKAEGEKRRYRFINRKTSEHGSNSMFQKGCRCSPCKTAHYRYNHERQMNNRKNLRMELDLKIKRLEIENREVGAM